MSAYTQQSDKGMASEPRSKDDMVPIGTTRMRPSADSREVRDGINGTINFKEPQLKTIGAGAGDYIWLKAEANGKSIDTLLQIHANGRSTTVPSDDRAKLNLEPNDEIRCWIATADDEDIPEDESRQVQKTLTGDDAEMDRRIVVFRDDPFTYHYLGDDAEETNCGLSLEDRQHRTGDDPADILDLCSDCAVRSSAEMTNEEIIDWLSAEERANFEKTGGPPGYLNKEQLVALRDAWLKMEDRVDELEDQVDEPKEDSEKVDEQPAE